MRWGFLLDELSEATDYAGKDKSFPISVPEDVHKAAMAMGRAGSDNYSTDELKSRIIAIAKRRGPEFVAQLPKMWQPDQQESETDLAGDFVALAERAVRSDGVVPLKLIQPGWGSSGYYSPQMLERDGPKVFTRGTHMYWDHPSTTDEAARPERSLRDLAAVLVSDATWTPNGSAGPGLYAQAKTFAGYREAIEEMAPHIGVSIRALGKAAPGEAEGRKGPVIESIQKARSVDFVTAPGAGGQILNLFESARERTSTHVQEGQMDNQELTEARTALAERDKALSEANTKLTETTTKLTEAETKLAEQATQIARLQERQLMADAKVLAQKGVANASLPDVTKARIVEAVSANPPVKDGALDESAFANRVTEAIKAEAAYLAEAGASGAIRGMGSAGSGSNADVEAARKRLSEAFVGAGLDEGIAKLAAAGRN